MKTVHNKQSLKRVITYLSAHWQVLTIASITSCLFGLFSAAPSYVVQYTVDEVFVKGFETLLIPFIILFLVLFILKGLFMYISSYYMNWVGNRMVNALRRDLFNRLIDLPPSFFINKTTGELMAHFLNDIVMIQNTASSTIRNGVRSVCEAVFLIAVAFLQSWKLCFIMLIVGPLVALAIAKTGSFVRTTSRIAQNEMGQLSSLLQEMFIGIREIKAFNSQDIEKKRFSKFLHRYFNSLMRCIHFESLAPALIEILAMSGIGFVLYVASRQVLHGSMTPGQLTSFFAALMLAYQPMKKLVTVYADIQYGLAAADRVFEIIDTPSTRSQKRYKKLAEFQNTIRFNNVSFAYHADQPIFKNVSLQIAKGESVGIIGPSGAGKSTLCDLLLGFIIPTKGSITIDNNDMCLIKLASLRQHIGYVSQQPFLFNDTVSANVSYALPNADQKTIEKACKAAHAHEFIINLPNGYQTQVGENGTNLSGGQKQRLTIARALLKNPKILIFDEATSALDTESEKMIRQALHELKAEKTIIVISHRLCLLEEMDRIYTFSDRQLIPHKKNAISNAPQVSMSQQSLTTYQKVQAQRVTLRKTSMK